MGQREGLVRKIIKLKYLEKRIGAMVSHNFDENIVLAAAVGTKQGTESQFLRSPKQLEWRVMLKVSIFVVSKRYLYHWGKAVYQMKFYALEDRKLRKIVTQKWGKSKSVSIRKLPSINFWIWDRIE